MNGESAELPANTIKKPIKRSMKTTGINQNFFLAHKN